MTGGSCGTRSFVPMPSPYGGSKNDSLLRRKAVDGCAAERFARLQLCRGKVWVVRRIRETLRLEAERPVLVVGPADPGNRPVQEIARIELNPRLRCEHL